MSEQSLSELRSSLPTAAGVLQHVVEALRDRDGSATNSEISKHVIDTLGISEAAQQIMRADGRRAVIEQVISEAKSRLRTAGFVDRSARDVWSLTELGENATHEQIADVPRIVEAIYRERRAQALEESNDEPADEVGDTEDNRTWREILIERLLAMEPAAFERLAQRILREAGFESVRVRGRSGDGGIDGEGVYRPLPLIGFQVYWQSKRYSGTVAAEDIRNFRGAMVGRGDKGLFITTGTFTGPARDEASREGAPPIDLIDGSALADLLASLGLGVKVTERVVRDHEVVPEWFDSI